MSVTNERQGGYCYYSIWTMTEMLYVSRLYRTYLQKMVHNKECMQIITDSSCDNAEEIVISIYLTMAFLR